MWNGTTDYPYEEFAEHFAALDEIRTKQTVERNGAPYEIGKNSSYEANVLRVWDYFLAHYPHEIAMEKGSLFMSILSHLSRHMAEFDQGSYAVTGGQKALVSEKLLRAIHHAFGTMTEEELTGHGPSPTRVKQLADTLFMDKK